MAELTVCIELDTDTGKISVGVEPPDEAAPQGGEAQAQQLMGGPQGGDEESEEQSYMRPVPSIDAALQVARQLLTQGQQAQGAQADDQMGQGFGAGNPAPSMVAAGK